MGQGIFRRASARPADCSAADFGRLSRPKSIQSKGVPAKWYISWGMALPVGAAVYAHVAMEWLKNNK